MNPNTNHLVTSGAMAAMSHIERRYYSPVPEHLQRAATLTLAGKEQATVSRTSGGKLSQWAASERKKRRLEKQARKRNRK